MFGKKTNYTRKETAKQTNKEQWSTGARLSVAISILAKCSLTVTSAHIKPEDSERCVNSVSNGALCSMGVWLWVGEGCG